MAKMIREDVLKAKLLSEWCRDVDVVNAFLEELPAYQEPEHDGWIPTRIAKPHKAGQYLETKQQKTGACQIATAHYNPSFDEWSGNGNFKKILAWQPLPSPYTQE